MRQHTSDLKYRELQLREAISRMLELLDVPGQGSASVQLAILAGQTALAKTRRRGHSDGLAITDLLSNRQASQENGVGSNT
jgi:hypothetical protein